jgi:uncharacterized protein YajQ (UPF0234 family)
LSPARCLRIARETAPPFAVAAQVGADWEEAERGGMRALSAGVERLLLHRKAMPDNSFDIVSTVEMPEVINAIQQALKEVIQRYDLKDSKSKIELNEKDKKILLESQDDYKIKAIAEILESKLVKRKVPLKALSYGTIAPAASSRVRQEITLQVGIPTEKAREIVKAIKDSKKKVQASIQGDLVRVAGKDRDVLQEVMALLRAEDFGIDMQFINYRSN